MTAGPPPDEDRQSDEQGDDEIVNNVSKQDRAFGRPGERDTALGVEEQVYGPVAAGAHSQQNDECDPGNPDQPLDPVDLAPIDRAVIDRLDHLLHPAARADPTTPGPAEKQGGDEHQPKHDQAAVDDAIRCPIDDDVRREVVHGDGERKEGQDDERLADTLAER